MATVINAGNIGNHMSAYNCIPFEVTLTDAGTDPVEISAYFFLENVTDNVELTRSVIPFAASGSSFDARVQVRRQLITQKPLIGNTGAFFDTSGSKEFRITYGQLNFDGSTCVTTEIQNGQTSTFRAVNSNFKFYATNPLNAAVTVLSARPYRNYTCLSGEDWLYIYPYNNTTTGYSVYVVINYKDGTTNIANINATNTAIGIMPIGLGNGFFNTTITANGKTRSDVKSYEVRVYDEQQTGDPPVLVVGNLISSYLFTVDDCCNDDDMVTLVWLELEGGYAGLDFNTTEALGTAKTQNSLRFAEDCAIVLPELGNNNGLRSRGSSGVKITLSREMKWDKEAKFFLTGLFASNNHFLKVKTKNDTFALMRFVIEGGDYNYFNSDDTVIVSVTGTLSMELEGQTAK